MHATILPLIGSEARFLNDRVFFVSEDGDSLYYDWREGDLCYISGYVKYPDSEPCLLVFYGDSFGETVEIPLGDFLTELAIAGRRRSEAAAGRLVGPPVQSTPSHPT